MILLGVFAVAGALVACPASLGDRCASGVCDGSEGGAGEAGPDAAPTDRCIDTPADPSCLKDDEAFFVSSTKGDDAASGTKDKPFKTLTTALGKITAAKKRIYVCDGTYAEDVVLDAKHDGVSLFGGFTCDWAASTSKPKIGAGTSALRIASATGVAIVDMAFDAKDATAPGSSSIAAFVASAEVTFKRVSLSAGKGAAGAAGASGQDGSLSSVSSGGMTLNGNLATGLTAGAMKECTCSSGDKTTGGGGGPPTLGGGAGLPDLSAPLPDNGTAGVGGVACSPNGAGHNGAPASEDTAAASAPTTFGVLDEKGWTPQAGPDATAAGKPGQGGGGGGGRDGSSAGGGGGCGGCGGLPGKGGSGGGASIALLVNASTISLSASTLSAKDGGSGGAGGAGGAGLPGGGGGQGAGSGCAAGEGGHGAAGGAGAGGAGGVSVAILYKGTTAPALDEATQGALSVKTPGLGGTGGKAGVNNGPPGVAEKIKDATAL